MIKYIFLDFNGTLLDDLDLCLDFSNKISSSCGKIGAVDSCISDIEKKIKLLSYQKNHIKK